MPGASSTSTGTTWTPGGTTTSTPGPRPTSTPSPTCRRRPPTAPGTRPGGWRRPRPTASWPRSSSPTRSRPSSRRGTWSPSRRRPRTTPVGGRGCRPTTGGRSTSATQPPVGGRRPSRSSSTTSTTRWPRCAGPRRPTRCWPVSCCRRSRPTRACPGCGSRTTTRCGGSVRSSRSPSRSTAAVAYPTTATTRRPGRCCSSSCPGSPTAPCGTSSSPGCWSATRP